MALTDSLLDARRDVPTLLTADVQEVTLDAPLRQLPGSTLDGDCGDVFLHSTPMDQSQAYGTPSTVQAEASR